MNDLLDLPKLKWPRPLEIHPRLPELEARTHHNRRPLWEHGKVKVAHIDINPAFQKILMTLNGRQQIERGLEQIASTLANESRGLKAAMAQQGTRSAFRLSRLLLIGEDGSERFNRGCERLLLDHADRLLGLRIFGLEAQVIEKLYGNGAQAKALLISHRDAVARALWALIEEDVET